MFKGGKHDEIMDKYSSPKDADVYNLDERAKRIVFGLLLKPKSFKAALDYPINISDKYERLYQTDRIQFLEYYVLNDFSDQKFKKWVEDPVALYDSDLFDIELPTSLFEKIFSLPMMDEWIQFMKLEDANHYRVMKNSINVNRIIEAICNVLAKKNYTSLASCFLDVMFNNPYYNHANANSHIDTLIEVFNNNDISNRDFSVSSKRNIYFTKCDLSGHDLDNIKDNLRSFVEYKIDSYKKIKNYDLSTVKTLCKIYEKAAKFKQNEDGKYVYDYDDVLHFFNRIKREKQLPKELIDFIEVRKSIVEARYNKKITVKNFKESLPGTITPQFVIDTLDKDDTVWFINYIYGKKSPNKDLVDLYKGEICKKIYEYSIYLSDFERNDTKKNLRTIFGALADDTIETILSKDKIDEYMLKIYAYTYEVFAYDDIEKASKYDSLSKNPRLAKLYRLISYLQQRALHYYSYMDEDRYNSMLRKYDINFPINIAREKIRPNIEMREKPTEQPSPSPTKKSESDKNDAAKEKAKEIAKNALGMGMDDEMIIKLTGLSLKELKQLKDERN